MVGRVSQCNGAFKHETGETERARGRRTKKERSGLQSACDELIDKVAFITGE